LGTELNKLKYFWGNEENENRVHKDLKKEEKNSKKPTRQELGKPKTDLFENRPLVGFRFIENRSVSVSVSVSRRALSGTPHS
jgi:hypothetical protein